MATIRESLPYAYGLVADLSEKLRAGDAEFADNQTPPPSEAERGRSAGLGVAPTSPCPARAQDRATLVRSRRISAAQEWIGMGDPGLPALREFGIAEHGGLQGGAEPLLI